jgi:hypothetical protein
MALGVPYTGGAGLILALQVVGSEKNASVPIFLSGLHVCAMVTAA